MKRLFQRNVLRFGAATLLLLVGGAALGLASGCSEESTASADAGDAGADGSDASADATTDGGKDAAADAADAAVATGATPVVTGIPECDDLLDAYGKCLDRKPELKKNEVVLYNVRKTSLRIQSVSEPKESVANRCKMLFERRYKTNCMM